MSANQLFVIGSGVFQAVSIEEADATAEALKELDLYKLPYDKVDMQFLFDDIAVSRETGEKFPQMVGPCGGVRFTDVTTAGYGKVYTTWGNKVIQDITLEVGDKNPGFPARFLIAVLATRNIVKRTKEHKLAKLGIGKNRTYRYSTTITLPVELDDDPDHVPQEGQPKCPHLRRGHIRRQHWGRMNSCIKQIWIAPVFVNADKDYISTRTHYNL